MGAKVRTARKYAIRAVVFQEGDWLCAQCLEYDLVAQAKSLPRLYEALRRLIIGHIAVRARAIGSNRFWGSRGRRRSIGTCSSAHGLHFRHRCSGGVL